jgi:hypothetical protein
VTPPTQQQISSLDYGTPPKDYEATVKEYFNSVLFDPYTAHYDFMNPVGKFWYKTPPLLGNRIYAGYLVRVSVNAKTS